MTPLQNFLLALAASVCLAGCATAPVNCDGWKPIRPSAMDVKVVSDQLAGDILGHNEFGERIGCWKP